MENVFIFDVDGTLTPSRRKMDKGFEEMFLKWVRKNTVFLVTGSDLKKTKEQVPIEIINSCRGLFCCCGNEYYIPSSFHDQPVVDPGPIFLRNVYSREFKPSSDLIKYLESEVNTSKYHHKAGNHIENRGSLVNFSVVGRDCSLMERENYFKWDKTHEERQKIADFINVKWPELSATLGGQISIDIYPNGMDKSQVLDEIESPVPTKFIFFGDRTTKGGNDYPLAKLISSLKDNGIRHSGEVIPVKSWKDTMKTLQKEYNNEI